MILYVYFSITVLLDGSSTSTNTDITQLEYTLLKPIYPNQDYNFDLAFGLGVELDETIGKFVVSNIRKRYLDEWDQNGE